MAASSSTGSLDAAMDQCAKLLSWFTKHPKAAPFLEPVPWKKWGLNDYPKLVKHPMDLGTMLQKMEAGQYSSVAEFEQDMLLIWDNCMIYNRDGSEYYQLAQDFKRTFLEKFKKIRDSAPQEETRQPGLADKKSFAQSIYAINSEDLGKVVQILDQRCERCIRKIDADDIEIDIDGIDAATFWVVRDFVSKAIDAKKKRKGKDERPAKKART